jgi:hypothetical protein
VGRGKGISVLLREREALAFVEGDDEDAGFRGLDDRCLGEGFRGRYETTVRTGGKRGHGEGAEAEG